MAQKLVYSQLPYAALINNAALNTADPKIPINTDGLLYNEWLTSSGKFYRSVVFTNDGYIITHGLAFKVLNTTNSTDKPVLSNTNGNLSLSFGGVTSDSVSVLINASDGLTVDNGVVKHNTSKPSNSSTIYGTSISNYILSTPSWSIDNYGHVTGYTAGSTQTHLDYVASYAMPNNKTIYLLGHDAATTGANGNTDKTYSKASVYIQTESGGAATLNVPAIYVNGGSSSITFKDGLTTTTLTDYVTKTITDGIAANDAMVFAGTIYPNGVIHTVNNNILKAGTASEVTAGTADVVLNTTTLSTLNKYSAGWTWKIVANGTTTSGTITDIGNVEVGDMVIAVSDRGTSYSANHWTVVLANIDGAVTTASNLTTGGIVWANGNKTITSTGTGINGQYLKSLGNTNGPVWATFGKLTLDGTSDFEFTASDSNKTLLISNGLDITSVTNGGVTTYTLGHSNSLTALTTEGIYKFKYDANGHISAAATLWDPNTITFSGVKSGAYNGTVLSGNNVPIYDPDGTSKTIMSDRGIVIYTNASGNLVFGHSNNISELTTASLKKFTYDSYGHITGVSDVSNLTFGAVNSSGTAKLASGQTAHPTYNPNEAKSFFLKEGTNVTITQSVSGNDYTYEISSPNTWRPVYAWLTSGMAAVGDTIDNMLPNSTNTRALSFASSFGYVEKSYTISSKTVTVSEIDLVWGEVAADGTISYVS